MKNSINLSISMPPSFKSELEQVAKEEGRTLSDLIREALRRYIITNQYEKLQNEFSAKAKAIGLADGADIEDKFDEGVGEGRI
jgi:metal-responsive CopG/Arc/MetJ family transcriptional regulator